MKVQKVSCKHYIYICIIINHITFDPSLQSSSLGCDSRILFHGLPYRWIWTWGGGWRLSRRGRRRSGRTRTRSWSAATSLHTADISAPWGCKDNKCTVGIEPAAYRRWRWLLRRAWPRCTPGGPPAPGTSGSSWWCSAAPWILELQT